MSRNGSQHFKGIAAIITAALLWSTGGVFIKLISLNAYQISAMRGLFTALTFIILFRKKAFALNKLTVFTAFAYAGILILFVVATKMTTAANAIFLQYTAPIYVLLLEPLLLGTKLTRTNVCTSIICFSALGLFFLGEISPANMTGNAIALLSGISFAAFLLAMRKNGDEYRLPSIFWGNIIIVLVCLPSLFSIEQLLWRDIWMSGFLGVFQIGIAYAVFTYGLKRVEAIEASLISMIEPVLNPVWVFIWYAEKPNMYAVAGGVIILVAIATRTILAETDVRRITRSVQ